MKLECLQDPVCFLVFSLSSLSLCVCVCVCYMKHYTCLFVSHFLIYFLLEEELWQSKKIKDAIVHPQLNTEIPLPFRMSAFVPANIFICAGLLIPNPSTLAIIFWQWVNQSYNIAGINFPFIFAACNACPTHCWVLSMNHCRCFISYHFLFQPYFGSFCDYYIVSFAFQIPKISTTTWLIGLL